MAKQGSRIGRTWTDGNGITHTWTKASEKAHRAWLKRTEARLSGKPTKVRSVKGDSERENGKT